MQTVNLSVDLVNAILQYLGTKPFNEVNGLIAETQRQAQAGVQAQPQEALEAPVAAENSESE